jgi:hypothetical protein
MKGVMYICLVLSLAAAVFYFLMAAGIVTVPALKAEDSPRNVKTIVYAAAGCYVLGGLLILAGKRWLWTIGLVMNTLVMLVFFTMYAQKPEVITSLPGLGTKIAQILLEAGLVYLIINYKKISRSRT